MIVELVEQREKEAVFSDIPNCTVPSEWVSKYMGEERPRKITEKSTREPKMS